MNVTILSYDGAREFSVDSVEVFTMQGSYTILRGHAPFTAQLMPAKPLSMKLKGGATKTITLGPGALQVTRAEVRIILA